MRAMLATLHQPVNQPSQVKNSSSQSAQRLCEYRAVLWVLRGVLEELRGVLEELRGVLEALRSGTLGVAQGT